MVSHVVFDMDGVFYPLTPAINQAFSEAAAHSGLALGAKLTFNQAMGLAAESFEATGSSRSFFKRDYDINDFEMMVAMHRMIDVESLLTPDPAMRKGLEDLLESGRTCSVLTSADREYAHRVLDRLKLRDLFHPDQIIGGDMYIGHSKSRSVQPFQIALERSGRQPEETAMVEDFAINLEVPHKMGFRKTVHVHCSKPSKPVWVHEKHQTTGHFLRTLKLM